MLLNTEFLGEIHVRRNNKFLYSYEDYTVEENVEVSLPLCHRPCDLVWITTMFCLSDMIVQGRYSYNAHIM